MQIRPFEPADTGAVVDLSLRAWAPVHTLVETGADPGHAPARRTYEKAGMKLVPVARYFMKL